MADRAQGWCARLIVACGVALLGAACGEDGQVADPIGVGGAGGAVPFTPTAGSSGILASAGTGGTAGAGGTAAGAGGAIAGAAGSVAGASGMSAGASGMVAGAGASGGAGGAGMGGAGAGAGGMPAPGDWPAADPAQMGPFATTMESNVGPDMMFTMFRPMELTRRHPVITWGNGTGTMPTTYRRMLTLYASHGFIVIASNSTNVAQGTPPPMLNGVTWVLEQDMTSGSALFEHVDREHIGATGHSQGAFATSTAGADERIKTIAPIQGARAGTLHGPAMMICGSDDTTVPCSGATAAFERTSSVPVMYAEAIGTSHTNWIGGGAMHPIAVATTAWFRVHLMGDTALRPMFYGADCGLCQDNQWVIMQKMME